MFKNMPINATFVFKEAYFVMNIEGMQKDQGYRTVNVVEYVICKIFGFLDQAGHCRKLCWKLEDEGEKAK